MTEYWAPTDKEYLSDKHIKYNLLLWGKSISGFKKIGGKTHCVFPKSILNFSHIERFISQTNADLRGCKQRTGTRATIRSSYDELINLGLWYELDEYIGIAPTKGSSATIDTKQIYTIVQTLKDDETKILLWLTQMKSFEKTLPGPFVVTKKKGTNILGYSYNNSSQKKIQEIFDNLQDMGFIQLTQAVATTHAGQLYKCYHIQSINLDANPFEIPPADYDGPIEDIMDEF